MLPMILTISLSKFFVVLVTKYSSLAFAVKARETLISFDELHEKLITHEAQLKQDQDKKLLTPTFIYLTTKNPNSSPHHNYKANSYRRNSSSNNPHLPASSHQPRPPPKPFRGFCQLCGIEGHFAK